MILAANFFLLEKTPKCKLSAEMEGFPTWISPTLTSLDTSLNAHSSETALHSKVGACCLMGIPVRGAKRSYVAFFYTAQLLQDRAWTYSLISGILSVKWQRISYVTRVPEFTPRRSTLSFKAKGEFATVLVSLQASYWSCSSKLWPRV